MDRRTLLRRSAALVALGLAGCTDAGSPADGDGSPTPGGDGTPTPAPPTTTEPTTVADFTFEVTNIDSAATEPTAEVTFETGENRVRVTGTIQGSDGCKTAALEAIDYDRAADEVTLSVITEDRESAGDACTQALVYIDYEATVSFTGGLPSRAAISHDGTEITSGAHDSATAGDGS